MKKFIITLAALGSLSGIALAERPSESSDRVDYKVNAAVSYDANEQTQGLATVDTAPFGDDRRVDEKNDNVN